MSTSTANDLDEKPREREPQAEIPPQSENLAGSSPIDTQQANEILRRQRELQEGGESGRGFNVHGSETALGRPPGSNERVGVNERVNQVLKSRPELGADLGNLARQLPMGYAPGQGNDLDPHVRIGRAIHKYASAGDDAGRQQAIQDLKKEALSGDNPSAIKALRDLSTFDAALRLADSSARLKNNPNNAGDIANRNRAMMDLAALELSDQGGAAKKFLDAQSMQAQERVPQPGMISVAQGRALAKVEKAGREDNLADQMKLIGSDNPAIRASALANINAIAGEGVLQDNFQMEKAAQFAGVVDAISGAKTSPDAAAKSMGKLHELAQSGNKYAQDLLDKMKTDAKTAPLANTQDPMMLKNMLRNPDIMQAMQNHTRPIEAQARNFQNMSGKQILDSLSTPEERAQAKREVERQLERNFEQADKSFGTFLDRKSGPDDRQKSIEDLKKLHDERLGKFGQNDFENPLRRMESFDAIKSVHEAKTPEDAAKSLSKLQELAGQGKHHDAAVAIHKLTGGKPEKVQETIDKLQGKDPSGKLTESERKEAQQKALADLKRELPDGEKEINEIRSTRIARDLHAGATEKQFQDASIALEAEKEGKNESAGDWLKWTKAGESAAKLNAAPDKADPKKEATDAVAQLVKDAKENPHARAALAGILMSGADGADRQSWLNAGHGKSGDKPVLVPDISKLPKDVQDAVKLEAAKALSDLAKADPKSLNPSEASALSISAAQANKEGKPELSKVLNGTLDELMKTDARPQVMKGIFDAIRSGAEGNETLTGTYLKGTADPSFPQQFRNLANWAKEGDQASVKVLAGLSSGLADKGEGKNANNDGTSFADRSRFVLTDLAKLPGQDTKVLSALADAQRQYPDQAKLLATMGTVAAGMDQSKVGPEVHKALQDGLASTDKDARKSAVEGTIAMAPHWGQSYRDAVLKNLSPEMVGALRDNVEKIPENHRAAILEAQHQKLKANDASFEERKAAAQTMSALAKYATKEQVETLSGFGGAEGAAKLHAMGLDAKEQKALQGEIGKALTRMMVLAPNAPEGTKGAREAAFDAFKKHSWPGLEKPELKNALENYAQGKPFDLSVNKELGRILYEASLPRPAAGILKDWGVPGSDKELFDKAKKLTDALADPKKGPQSGEEALRQLAANIDLVNSLDPRVFPGLRKELTGSENKVIPAQVVGQILQGQIKSGENAPLLTNLGAKLGQMHRDAQLNLGKATDEFKQAGREKRESLRELTEHTKKGVGLGDRVAYVFGNDYIDKFDAGQKDLVEKFQGKDKATIEKGNALAQATARLNALDLAMDIKAHTELKNSGKQMEADKLAVSLMQKHNAYLSVVAETVFKDLTISSDGQSGRSGLARLKDAGLGQFSELPEFKAGKEGYDKALETLAAIRSKGNIEGNAYWSSRFADTEGMRSYALGRVDADSTLSKFSQASRVLDRNLGDMQELFEAAAKGSKYDKYIEETRSKAEHVARLLKDPTKEIESLKNTNFSEAQRRQAFDKLMINVDDKNTRDALWDKVKSGNFDAATAKQLQDATGYISSQDIAQLKSRTADMKVAYEKMLRGPQEDLARLSNRSLSESDRRKTFDKLTANLPDEAQKEALWDKVKDGRIDSQSMEHLQKLNKADQQTLDELKKRIDTMEQMTKLLDPSSDARQNLQKLTDQITSPNFKPSTFANWAKENGPVIAASIVAIAATAAAAATFGAATPLAVAGWALVGATATLAATEMTKEGLYQLNSRVGYTGFGVHGERSKLGDWVSKIGDRDLATNLKSLLFDVAGPYSQQIAFDTAIALGTMGVGKLFAGSLSKMGSEGAKAFMANNGATMSKIAQQGEQIAELAAQNPKVAAMLGSFFKHMGKETVWQTGYTGLAMLAEHGAHKVLPEDLLAKAGPSFSVGIGLGLALLDPHLRSINFKPGAKGPHTQIEIPPGINEAEVVGRLAEHMRKQGHDVAIRDGEIKVHPYDAKPGEPGFTIGTTREARFPDPPAGSEGAKAKPLEKAKTVQDGEPVKPLDAPEPAPARGSTDPAAAGKPANPIDRLSRITASDKAQIDKNVREDTSAIRDDRAKVKAEQEARKTSIEDLEKKSQRSPQEDAQLLRLRQEFQVGKQKLDTLNREMQRNLDNKLDPLRQELREQMPALEAELKAKQQDYQKAMGDFLKKQNEVMGERLKAKESGDPAKIKEADEKFNALKEERTRIEQEHRAQMQDLRDMHEAASRILSGAGPLSQNQSTANAQTSQGAALNKAKLNEVLAKARPIDIALQAERGQMPRTRDAGSPYWVNDIPVHVEGKGVPDTKVLEVLNGLADKIVKPTRIEIINDSASPYHGLASTDKSGRFSTVKLNYSGEGSRTLVYDHELGHVLDHSKVKTNPELAAKVKAAYEKDLAKAGIEPKLNEALKAHEYVSPELKDAAKYGLAGSDKGDMHKAYVNSRDEVVAEAFKLFSQEKLLLKPGEKALTYKEAVEKYVTDPERKQAMLKFEDTYNTLKKEVFEPAFQADMQKRAGSAVKAAESNTAVPRPLSQRASTPDTAGGEASLPKAGNKAADLESFKAHADRKEAQIMSSLKADAQPAARESMAKLKELAGADKIHADTAKDIADIMSRMAIEGKTLSPEAVVELAKLKPQESSALNSELSRDKLGTLADLLNSKAMPIETLKTNLQNPEAFSSMLGSVNDMVKAGNGSKTPAQAMQVLSLPLQQQAAMKALFSDPRVSQQGFDTIMNSLAGKAGKGQELFLDQSTVSRLASGTSAEQGQLREAAALASKHLDGSLQRSPEIIKQLLELSPQIAGEFSSLARQSPAKVSDQHLAQIHSDLKSISSPAAQSMQASLHLRLALQDAPLHQNLMKLENPQLRADLMKAAALKQLSGGELSRISQAYESSPDMKAIIDKSLQTQSAANNRVQFLDGLIKANLSAGELATTRSLLESGKMKPEQVESIINSGAKGRQAGLELAASGKVTDLNTIVKIAQDNDAGAIAKAISSGQMDAAQAQKLMQLQGQHAEHARAVLKEQAEAGGAKLNPAELKAVLDSPQTAFQKALKVDSRYHANPDLIKMQKEAMSHVEKVLPKLNEDAAARLTEVVEKEIPALKGKEPREAALRVKQLEWLAENTKSMPPDKANQLAEQVAGSRLLASAHMADLRSKIPEGDIEVFLHGTSTSGAQTFINQQGANLSANSGAHNGKFFATTQGQTAWHFADRMVADRTRSSAGEKSALVGMAVPKATMQQLAQQGLVHTEPIADRPGMSQTIFKPEAIKHLKEKGYFFKAD